jgi:hypothetical protein
MENITEESIKLLSLLIPGFITSYFSAFLTASRRKESELDKIVKAFIWTVIINIIVTVLDNSIKPTIPFQEPLRTIIAVGIALLLAIILSLLYKNDIIHKFFRFLRITDQTAYPSEWFGTFTETKDYIILNLRDSRRLMGWPLEWPNDPKNGYFILKDASWLIPDGKGQQQEQKSDDDKFMIGTEDIQSIEFRTTEKKHVSILERIKSLFKRNKK